MTSESDRAWAMEDQVDVIVDFCTNIMSMIKKLADGEEDMGKLKLDDEEDA